MRSLLAATAAPEDWGPRISWEGRSRIGALAQAGSAGWVGEDLLQVAAPSEPSWNWLISPRRAGSQAASPAAASRPAAPWGLAW
jgi:hypothetical protein